MWKQILLSRTLVCRSDWDALNHVLFDDNPYYDSRFVDALLKYFGHGNERLLIHARDDIDGMLIVQPTKGKWVSFAPDQAQAVPVLVKHPDDLLELKMGWALEFLRQDSDAPMPSATIPYDHALTISVSLEGTFDDYWQKFSRKTRQEFSRRMRRAKSMELRKLETPKGMPDAVRRFGQMEQAGWKGQTRTAVSGRQEEFYVEVMTEFARSGQATVYELIIEGRIAAIQLAIHSSCMLVLLKTTYDETLRNLSPGRLMQREMLRMEFGMKRFQTVEFYTNADEAALAWATGSRHIRHHLLPRNAFIEFAYRSIRGPH